MSEKISVLFVCMGNICRSPSAEGVFTSMVQEAGLLEHLYIDSCGTQNYHAGNPPDGRSQQAAKQRGYDLSHLRARQVEAVDFEMFHYILAMDSDNFDYLMGMCPPVHRSKIRLFLSFGNELDEKEVPDPYYGGPNGFEHVLDLIENASQGLLTHIQENELASITQSTTCDD